MRRLGRGEDKCVLALNLFEKHAGSDGDKLFGAALASTSWRDADFSFRPRADL
jgi:hypothetical protein